MALDFDYDPNWKPSGKAPDAGPDFDYDPAWKPAAPAPVKGGLVASAKQAIGSTIKGAGQLAADFVPGVGRDNPLAKYGQSVVDANPTRVTDFASLKENPLTAVTEATGNAAGSMGAMLGARVLGQGITAASPLAGPAAPLVAGLGQAVSWAGPAAVAALPSFGGIRERQIQKDPNAADSMSDKLKAAIGAGAVGAIESRFGPQEWAMKAMTKEGRNALAEKFAANSLAGSVAKGAAKGAAIEGAEELAQNPIEQVAAGDNPLAAENLKDTAFGGVMGALGGGVLGGASGAGFRKQADAAKQPTQPPGSVEEPPAPVTPSNSLAVEQQILAEQEQMAAGINPADGPLSAAASMAVQNGAAKTPTQIALEQERTRAAELAAQQDAAESEIADATGVDTQADNLDWNRFVAQEQAQLADERAKAAFETERKRAQMSADMRTAADQMLAEGAYQAEQQKTEQEARQAEDPGIPFERIAPEDFDTLNPIKLGEGELVNEERRALPPPKQANALPNNGNGAPALGFKPKPAEPMRATADGKVGTTQQFDEFNQAQATRKEQMRFATERARDLVRNGARLQGRNLVDQAGNVVLPNLNLQQYRAANEALQQPNAQQNQPQATPAQAVQTEAQGQEQQPGTIRKSLTVQPSPETTNGPARPATGRVSSGGNSQRGDDAGGVANLRADGRSGIERENNGNNAAKPVESVPDAGPAESKQEQPVSKPYKLPLNLRDKNAALTEMASLMGKPDSDVSASFSAMWKKDGREVSEKRLVSTIERLRAEQAKQQDVSENNSNSAAEQVESNSSKENQNKQLAGEAKSEQVESQKDTSEKPSSDQAKSSLTAIFSDLNSSSKRKANKAQRTAKSHPKAAEIDYVQKNFHDILIKLMDDGKLTVNGVSSLSEENSQCL